MFLKNKCVQVLLLLISISITVMLFIQWQKYQRIKFGNERVVSIEKYRKANGQLPKDDDWKLLMLLGFEETMSKPAYQQINDKDFELIYLEGFDCPYLTYRSASDQWGDYC